MKTNLTEEHTFNLNTDIQNMLQRMANKYQISESEMLRRLILNEYRIFTRTYEEF